MESIGRRWEYIFYLHWSGVCSFVWQMIWRKMHEQMCNQLKFYSLDIMDYQIINENEVSQNNECLFASILVFFFFVETEMVYYWLILIDWLVGKNGMMISHLLCRPPFLLMLCMGRVKVDGVRGRCWQREAILSEKERNGSSEMQKALVSKQ